MKNLKYVIYKEGKYYVSQCLNVDVSSFGNTVDNAVKNLKEALELYFEENKSDKKYLEIDQVIIPSPTLIPFMPTASRGSL